ncbi:MAG: hypothetical protein AB7O04_03520, partial [Hyphomonadaceae bacterium]
MPSLKRPAAAGSMAVLWSALAVAAAHAQIENPPPQRTQPQSNAPIEMGALRQMDAWTVGAIARGQGALPETLWAGADPAFLGALFDRFPAAFTSPAALDLARRALASGAEAPAGDGAVDAARKRFEALGRIGFADELSTMAAGAALNDPRIAQFAAQAELARARVSDACQRARTGAAEEPPPFLLRLRAYCYAVGGEAAAADLALEVARAANAEDAWLRTAISALSTRPARLPAARFDTSLNASVSLAAQLPAGQNPLANSSALALLVVARTET